MSIVDVRKDPQARSRVRAQVGGNLQDIGSTIIGQALSLQRAGNAPAPVFEATELEELIAIQAQLLDMGMRIGSIGNGMVRTFLDGLSLETEDRPLIAGSLAGQGRGEGTGTNAGNGRTTTRTPTISGHAEQAGRRKPVRIEDSATTAEALTKAYIGGILRRARTGGGYREVPAVTIAPDGRYYAVIGISRGTTDLYTLARLIPASEWPPDWPTYDDPQKGVGNLGGLRVNFKGNAYVMGGSGENVVIEAPPSPPGPCELHVPDMTAPPSPARIDAARAREEADAEEDLLGRLHNALYLTPAAGEQWLIGQRSGAVDEWIRAALRQVWCNQVLSFKDLCIQGQPEPRIWYKASPEGPPTHQGDELIALVRRALEIPQPRAADAAPAGPDRDVEPPAGKPKRRPGGKKAPAPKGRRRKAGDWSPGTAEATAAPAVSPPATATPPKRRPGRPRKTEAPAAAPKKSGGRRKK